MSFTATQILTELFRRRAKPGLLSQKREGFHTKNRFPIRLATRCHQQFQTKLLDLALAKREVRA